jgi:hypothetical protein
VTPGSVVVGYRSFKSPYCLHLHGEVAGSQSQLLLTVSYCQSVRLGFEPLIGNHGRILVF